MEIPEHQISFEKMFNTEELVHIGYKIIWRNLFFGIIDANQIVEGYCSKELWSKQ
jgi:hypothetical protein